MDSYSLLKLMHIAGITFLGGGLLAVWVSELESYRTTHIRLFVEAARYTGAFYNGLVVPGAIMLAISGYFLLDKLGLGFFDAPWIIGMWGIFLFEFIEGNTVTRVLFRKAHLHSQQAMEQGRPLNHELRTETRSMLNKIVHFWDLPNFLVIIYCGTVRPDNWPEFFAVFTLAIVVTALLVIFVPKLAEEQNQTPKSA